MHQPPPIGPTPHLLFFVISFKIQHCPTSMPCLAMNSLAPTIWFFSFSLVNKKGWTHDCTELNLMNRSASQGFKHKGFCNWTGHVLHNLHHVVQGRNGQNIQQKEKRLHQARAALLELSIGQGQEKKPET